MKTKLTVRGKTYPVTFQINKYTNGNLCLSLIDHSEGYPAPFCRLTTNLGPVSEVDMSDSAFIDTNNCPWAEDFLTNLEVAVPSGILQQSGYCTYPLYYFNMNEIRKYVEV